MLGVEPPVRGLALRIAQRAVLLLPALERRQAQPAGDEPVHVLEQQHFGEQVLVLGVRLQLAHGLVADAQQFLTGYGVLVLLDALEQKLLVLLLGRGGRAPQRGQHGSTCTVTSSSCRSRLSRSSTSSAMACAAATFASLSTAMVTSARSEEHTSELQSLAYLVCRLLLEKKKKKIAQGQPTDCVTRQ